MSDSRTALPRRPSSIPAASLLLLAAVLLAGFPRPAAAEPVEFRFDPPGNPKAVFLAGDFNHWNPAGKAMKDDDGDGVFTVTLDLPPGRYQYKFVADGTWIEDPDAAEFTDDGFGGKNSVLVVGGSTEAGGFVGGSVDAGASKRTAKPATPAKPAAGAKGRPAGAVKIEWKPDADYSQVFLAGEFNGWNPTALAMEKEGGAWTATLELDAGRYQYKFVADGTWIADPNADEHVDDGFGGQNGVLVVGGAGGGAAKKRVAKPAASAATRPAGAVTIEWKPDADYSQVFLAGEFNGWSPTALAMEKKDDAWTATVELAPGRYQYKFVADGTWIADPNADEHVDDGFGGQNGVLVVGEGGGAPSGAGAAPAPARKPAPPAGDPVPVEFSFQPVISGVSSVHLAGDFNGWSTTETPMKDADGDGTWTVTVPLPPGAHAYKFVVDGNTWLEDPNAEEYADDGYGGQNSIVHVGDAARPGGAGKPRNVGFEHRPSGKPGEVSLAGTFNNWQVGKTAMTDADGDGVWTATLLLPEGEYQYKFVEDGSTWVTDRSAEWFADDGFGGQNSGLTVDDRYPAIHLALGDGEIFGEGLAHRQAISEINRVSDTELVFTMRSYNDDVESVQVEIREDGAPTELPLEPFASDATFRYWRAKLVRPGGIGELRYAIRYRDGGREWWLGPDGLLAEAKKRPEFSYSEASVPRFATPEWVRDGVFYQIFPERFANGDPSNDPDFSEPYYQGRTALPTGGTLNGEYYHLEKDWYDVAGLTRSRYRTDGKPDYFSFWGGDIRGVRENLDYLEDLGVTILYFNPLFEARSNHKYEAYDYKGIDPHFGTPEEFRAFVDECHARGIRVVADWVINHIGDHSPWFQDTVKKGKESEYWNWFEWRRWPLPAKEPADWREYYECWWGFAHMPDLNYDLSRPNQAENSVSDVADAEPNRAVVDYVLEAAEWWLRDMDVDGFRLDVPNEVPFWVWGLFREKVREIKPDAYLVGEIWSDAGEWVSPDCFDATMNYKYFKDPVSSFLGQGRMDAKRFDAALAAGRLAYPEQAVRVMMNLVGSHDTPRYLTAIGGDRARQKLTALFAMTYVGAPHVYYGDEIAMEGGADPDCRRPFRWNWTEDPERVAMHDWYRRLIRLRRENAALTSGEYRTLVAEGTVHAFARTDGKEAFVVVTNAGDRPVEIDVPVGVLGAPDAGFDDVLGGGALSAKGGKLRVALPAVSGTVLRRTSSS